MSKLVKLEHTHHHIDNGGVTLTVNESAYPCGAFVWTKAPHGYAGYKEIIKREVYPETGVNTRWKFWKQLFKQTLRK